MKTQHTPGKWDVEFSKTGYDVFAGVEHIAAIKQTTNNEREANATLIAAAPEMLNVLKATLYDLRNDPENESGWIEQAKEQIWNVLIQAGHDWHNTNEKEVSA